jgi:transposase-like protein
MTHRKQDTTLVEILQGVEGDGRDALRKLVEHTVQLVLEEEMTAYLKAEPYKRNDTRRGWRNGYKPRTLKTRVGRLELQVPKDRDGQFRTELFDKYQRNEKALVCAIAQMYVQGVSTRKVKKITEELCGLEISKSQVSNLVKELDKEIAIWRTRPFKKQYPYLVVDARYEKIRRNARVISQGALLVIGIDEDGYRETLGVWCADTENETTWSDVFKELKQRELKGVRYIVSDDHDGLVKAIRRHFQGADWQRCQVHFIRNILSRVPKHDRSRVVTMLKEITESRTYETAYARLRRVVEDIAPVYPNVADYLEDHGEEIFAVYRLPEHHRRQLRSTNMLERYNQELKRRTRVIRIFPDERSCIRLLAAMAIDTNEEWMTRRYLTMEETSEVVKTDTADTVPDRNNHDTVSDFIPVLAEIPKDMEIHRGEILQNF